jgi:hypothetical protein
MTLKSYKLPPMPRIVFIEKEWEGASVTLEVDATSKWGGAISPTKFLRAAPLDVLEDVILWILIQMERKRMGLRYLTTEEIGPIYFDSIHSPS